jgi:DNA-binding transcriptional LysR family regulator
MNVSLRQLRAFLAVTELGSFTRAGERMHLSQSGVSALIAELEANLRVKLLDRTTRRVEPTDAGRQFGAQAAKIVSDLDHAVRHAHGLSQRLHGRLTFCAPPLLATTILPAVIAAHRTAYPGIAITLLDGGTQDLVEQIRAGEVDFGIGTVPEGLDDLETLPLAEDHLILFCPAGHTLTRNRQVAWEQLAGQALITLTRQSGLRRIIDDSAISVGLRLEPAFEVAQITTAVAMVEAGLGIAVLPSIARALGGHPAIVTRRLVRPDVVRSIHMVLRQGHSLSPAGVSFMALLREEIGRLSKREPLSVTLAT